MVVLVDSVCLNFGYNLVEDISKVSRAIQRASLERVLIARYHGFQAVHPRVENVSIQCKAMRRSVSVRWDRTTESIESDLFVCVVVLENFANISDCLQILVALWIKIMERILLSGISI